MRQPIAFERWRAARTARRAHGAPCRVLLCHSQLPGETGSGVYLQKIAAEAYRQGMDVNVLTAGYDSLGADRFPGLPPTRIRTVHFARPGAAPRANAVLLPIAGMSLAMPYPTCNFRDLSKEQLETYAAGFAQALHEAVTALQPDVLHVNHRWFLAALTRVVAPWIPVVVAAHGTAYKLLKDAPYLGRWVLPAMAAIDHLAAISEDSIEESIDAFGVPDGVCSIEGYGFDASVFRYRDVSWRSVTDRLGVSFGSDVRSLALFVGKLVDWKGLDCLLEAIATLRAGGESVGLLAVGDGPPERWAATRAHIASLGVTGAVAMPGKVPREALPEIYASADVFVLSSFAEPWGLVLMEALACGAPAVYPNEGGPAEYVPSPLVARRLVSPIDPIGEPGSSAARKRFAGDLAGGIRAMLQQRHPPIARSAIAESMQYLSWGRLVQRLHAIYTRLGATVSRAYGP